MRTRGETCEGKQAPIRALKRAEGDSQGGRRAPLVQVQGRFGQGIALLVTNLQTCLLSAIGTSHPTESASFCNAKAHNALALLAKLAAVNARLQTGIYGTINEKSGVISRFFQ